MLGWFRQKFGRKCIQKRQPLLLMMTASKKSAMPPSVMKRSQEPIKTPCRWTWFLP